MTPPQPALSQRLTPVQWTVCVIAAIGFAFDIYELLMLPLIARPALLELIHATPGSADFNRWVAILFYVPALAGGLVGLVGGYLTDRLGRRFVLTWSILLYAFSAFLAGFSTNIYMLLILRCTTFIGVCVEFVAAVAWLAELFPDPKQRERVIGYTQAFSSVGGLMVAVANGFLIQFAGSFPAIAIPGFLTGFLGDIEATHQHEAWRYTLMSGLIPAIPLILIRPFLPESPVWAKKRAEGTLRRPSLGELFSPALRRTSLVTTIGFACTLAAAFGAIQQMPQIVPGLADVQAGAEAAAQAAVQKKAQQAGPLNEESAAVIAKKAKADYNQKIASEYTKIQEIGGLTGRFLLAVLVVGAISWRGLLRIFQIPGLIITPLVFFLFLSVENTHFFTVNLEAIYLGKLPITTMSLGMFLVGLCTVAQLSFWGNYLPHVYPVHLRGTGESMAANVGGRMIGTSAAALTAYLATLLPYQQGPMKFAVAAAIVGGTAYAVGVATSFFLPEPHPGGLPEAGDASAKPVAAAAE
jgi:MFS family permease